MAESDRLAGEMMNAVRTQTILASAVPGGPIVAVDGAMVGIVTRGDLMGDEETGEGGDMLSQTVKKMRASIRPIRPKPYSTTS